MVNILMKCSETNYTEFIVMSVMSLIRQQWICSEINWSGMETATNVLGKV